MRLLRVQPGVSAHEAIFFHSGKLCELQPSKGAENLQHAQQVRQTLGTHAGAQVIGS